jgi:hypothetical protein
MIRVADPPENDRLVRLPRPWTKSCLRSGSRDFRKKQGTRLQAIHASLIDGIVDTVSDLGRKQVTTSPQIPPSLRPEPMGRLSSQIGIDSGQ